MQGMVLSQVETKEEKVVPYFNKSFNKVNDAIGWQAENIKQLS